MKLAGDTAPHSNLESQANGNVTIWGCCYIKRQHKNCCITGRESSWRTTRPLSPVSDLNGTGHVYSQPTG